MMIRVNYLARAAHSVAVARSFMLVQTHALAEETLAITIDTSRVTRVVEQTSVL